MAWINGQWVEDTPAFGGGYVERDLGWVEGPGYTPGFGGMLGGFGGYVERDLGGPRPPYVPPTEQQPIYDRGGVQPSSPTSGRGVRVGMLGNIDQWNPVQTPEWQPLDPWQPVSPPQMRPPMPPPLPPMGPPRPPPTPPVMRPPMPPIPPTIGDGWPRPDPGLIDLIDTGPQDTRTQKELNAADHAFNIAQRERTKVRLAEDRAKTKRHYAKLRAKKASPQTIAKAKAKSKARGTKIKAQHPTRRSTIIYD